MNKKAKVCAYKILQNDLKIPANDLKNNQTATNPKNIQKLGHHGFYDSRGFASKHDIYISFSQIRNHIGPGRES